MMRSYWIRRGDFCNQYRLAYCGNSIDEELAEMQGYERITRKEAIAACVAERHRAKYAPHFSGDADSYIYPFMSDDSRIDFCNYPWAKIGYFVVKIG